MPSPPFEVLQPDMGGGVHGGGKPPVNINLMKRNMTVAKGFLDISLLSANANQLRNVVTFGNEDSYLHYLILSGIIISIILQVSAGVVLLVAEKFDINKEEEQERGNLMNTVVTVLIFLVLVINVFVACMGVDMDDPYQPHPQFPPSKGPYPDYPKGVYKD